MTHEAAAVGFDWADISGVLAKLDEEVAELRQALDQGDGPGAVGELGDLLFTMVNLARHLSADPGAALRGSTARFEARFAELSAALSVEGERIRDLDGAALEVRWQAAKRRLRG